MPAQHPLFPLNTVLFPGGLLPLQIFEARYLEMVSDCLRNDRAFGVCLIRSGAEAGEAAETVEVGTLARIVDWRRLDNGLLGITARGEGRFRVLGRTVAPNQLVTGEIAPLADEARRAIPPAHRRLAELVRKLLAEGSDPDALAPERYEDASWVGYRLAELVPVPLTRKQYFLELEDPIERLNQLADIIASIAQAR